MWWNLAIVILSLNILATPGLSIAVTVTGGPLGIPGSTQGPIPTGANSSPTATATATAALNGNQTRFQPGVQALGTILAVLCAVLTTTTYAVLIGPGTRLLSTSKLPLVSIEENIGSLLSRAWPDTSASTEVSSSPGKSQALDAMRILYVGRMDDEEQRAARGVEACRAVANKRISTPPMWLTTGSSLTKSMVQLAVWEWVCMWMVLAMLLSTLSFNGLLTSDRGPDSYPRFVVVMIYTGAFCVHSWYVWRAFRSFFTMVVAGASWSLLNKASFASADLAQLVARLAGGQTAPVFKQVGKPATSSTFPICPAALLQDVGVLPAADSEILTDAQKSEADTVGNWQKRDVTSTVESGKTALDGVVANIMTMVGIIITTGFSVWTSRATDSTSQLGSLALLASLTLGSAAMFSSAVDLSVMDTSFRNVLFLKEVMINGDASAHVQKRGSSRNVIGFMHKTVKTRRVRMRDLINMTDFWPLVFFGPAYVLLPSRADHERQSAGASFELRVSVRGKPVLFTTEDTNRHNTKADGSNVEAINVCYDPDPAQPTTTTASVSRWQLVGFWRKFRNKASVDDGES
jgi:hypothetical protein